MNTTLSDSHSDTSVKRTALEPWLTVSDSAKAIEFYKKAFDAIETYRLETPDGLIAKLSVNGAEFWVSNGDVKAESESLGAGTIRMILNVADPYPVFDTALQAGAVEIFPIGEDYGWLLGRIVDPFGLHWEIGHPVG